MNSKSRIFLSGKAIVLADANSFYCSAETIFTPWLRRMPVIVLSNNDGNVIARNGLSKKIGIKMGQPWHEVVPLYRQGLVNVFSPNFSLYQDISNRFMEILERDSPRFSPYSIDEAWLDATGIQGDIVTFGRYIKDTVMREVGIPTGIGIGPSKTTAKLANWAAKKWSRQTGNVVDIRDPLRLEKLLRYAPVHEVWGIGPRLANRLANDLKITTAWQLATSDPKLLRRYYGVTVERTARELLGECCYAFEESPEPKQMIASTRSFGNKVYDFEVLSAAVATFTARAASKLRAQGSLAQCLQVFARTSAFARGEPYNGHQIVALPYPTSDSRDLIRAANLGLQRIYRQDMAFAKAGVILSQFVPAAHRTDDLFEEGPSPSSEAVMKALDTINAKMGRGNVRLAREGAASGWEMRRQFLSPSYTTRWSDLPVAR